MVEGIRFRFRSKSKSGFSYFLRRSEEINTEMEEMAIAADANIGCNMNPTGIKIPVAIGIPF